jgi:hypothetical protein
MKTPIIFLDFDGVLNQLGRTYGGRDPERWVDADCVARVDRLVKETGAKIVISSSWRLGYSRFIMQGILQMKGLGDVRNVVIDVTGGYDERPRGEEIQDWRTAHGHTGPYAILDDLPAREFEGHLTHLVNTNGKAGFTEGDYDRAKKILTTEA